MFIYTSYYKLFTAPAIMPDGLWNIQGVRWRGEAVAVGRGSTTAVVLTTPLGWALSKRGRVGVLSPTGTRLAATSPALGLPRLAHCWQGPGDPQAPEDFLEVVRGGTQPRAHVPVVKEAEARTGRVPTPVLPGTASYRTDIGVKARGLRSLRPLRLSAFLNRRQFMRSHFRSQSCHLPTNK